MSPLLFVEQGKWAGHTNAFYNVRKSRNASDVFTIKSNKNNMFSNLYMAAEQLLLVVGHTKKRCRKSDSPRKSLKFIDVQYLAMINHPNHRPQGVRRCILEPSSNRLAEQCGVGHLAQTTVHLLLHRERLPDLIPHTHSLTYCKTFAS